MHFIPILLFITKVIVIDCIVEALKYGITALYNMWCGVPLKALVPTQGNRYFFWGMNVIETLCIAGLLYYNVTIVAIIFSTLFLVFGMRFLSAALEPYFS